jgi:hypothetical protein
MAGILAAARRQQAASERQRMSKRKPIAHWVRGKHRFEIFDEDDAVHGVVYVGYYDRKRSVCSRTEPGAASGLIRKHIQRLPDAKIIKLSARRRAKRDGSSDANLAS